MNGSLELTEGLVAVTGAEVFWADAAVVTAARYREDALGRRTDDLAGFEFPLKKARVVIEPRPADRRAALVLSVSLTPNSMRGLGLLLATKTKGGGMPCFTEGEWRRIAGYLRTYSALDQRHGETADGALSEEYAVRIEEAYGIGVSS